ncbi:MAG: hypothetical protein CVV27_10590 [Candidatus Melainabacteria bacterium HGW-Melainabacteria-1]|nr:MAG: hypothetical protein CVV27_10590 [Candidatus Melainabacteria bacterium HGW-Melainabacteria-1]
MNPRQKPYRYPSNDTIATLIGRLADMGVTMSGLRYLRVDQAVKVHRELRHWVSSLERARS